MEFFLHTLENLENRLNAIEFKTSNPYPELEDALAICKETILQLRRRVEQNGFTDSQQEILFFKLIKPKVMGYFYHYLNLTDIERSRPLGREKLQRKYFSNQILSLQSLFTKNLEFYEYHLRGCTDKDLEFFSRTNNFIQLHPDYIHAFTDSNFCTSHDVLLAKIFGNIRSIEFLQKKKLKQSNEYFALLEKEPKIPLKWTGSKVDLIELTYALYYSGRINNGQATLQEVSQALGKLFDMYHGDIYRTYIEIRARKTNPTKFLDALKQNLVHKMQEADG